MSSPFTPGNICWLYQNMLWEMMLNFHVRIDIHSKVISKISEIPIFNPACSHMLKISICHTMILLNGTSSCLFCCQFLGGKLPNFYGGFTVTGTETIWFPCSVMQSVFWEKIPVSYLGCKIFSSRTQLLANLQGLRLSDFLYHQSSLLSKEIEVTMRVWNHSPLASSSTSNTNSTQWLSVISHWTLIFYSWDFWISMELARTCYRPKQHSSLHFILWSFIGLWIKLRHRRIKQHIAKRTPPPPLQSSRSNHQSKKRRLLSFQSNCTATSDGCAQSLETISGKILHW